MKKYIFGTLRLSAAMLTACSLDENPESKFSEEEAFKSSTLTYVNTVANVYSAIGNGLYGDPYIMWSEKNQKYYIQHLSIYVHDELVQKV